MGCKWGVLAREDSLNVEVLLCAGQRASKNDSQNNLSERERDEKTRATRNWLRSQQETCASFSIFCSYLTKRKVLFRRVISLIEICESKIMCNNNLIIGIYAIPLLYYYISLSKQHYMHLLFNILFNSLMSLSYMFIYWITTMEIILVVRLYHNQMKGCI